LNPNITRIWSAFTIILKQSAKAEKKNISINSLKPRATTKRTGMDQKK